MEPLLPPERPKPRGGRPRVSGRAAMAGIVFVLRAGIQWEDVPAEMGCCGMTCWRRLRDWQAGGVWAALHRALLERLHGAERLDWSRASIDSASVPAKGGGAATSPNPTGRGKPGTERRLVVEGHGTPLGVALSGVNRQSAPGGAAARAAVRTSCTPTRATTTASAAPSAGAAASPRGSPGAASNAATASAATAGKSSARWLG